LELDEAARAGGEVTDDEERPLVADEVERARVRRPLVIGMALRRRDRRDGFLQFLLGLHCPRRAYPGNRPI
jgi:hypothetical protein